jgi:hypothetical protein
MKDASSMIRPSVQRDDCDDIGDMLRKFVPAISRETRFAGIAKFSDGRDEQEERNSQLLRGKYSPNNLTYAASAHRILFQTTPEARAPLAESASAGSPQTGEPCLDAGYCARGD